MHIQLLSKKSCVRLCCTLKALCLFDFKPVLMYCSCVDTREFVFNYSKILSSRNKAHLSFLKQTFISTNTHPGPVPGSDAKSMPPHWSYLASVPLPLLSRDGCISMLPVTSDRLWLGCPGRHTWVRDGGLGGKMGDLSANRVCL